MLEVGVGAGANFALYKKSHVHVTGVDFSSEMIKVARQTAANYQIDAEFIESDVESLIFEPGSFDCIVSTLTLCSYSNPIKILNLFNTWCKSGGKVLLMEHGLSSNALLSTTQKIINPIYKKISGCHCNRDIQRLLKQSKLEIEHIETYWKDIMYLVWAKPNKMIISDQ